MLSAKVSVARASITAFESHLTAPSRDDQKCLDLWFSFVRSVAGPVWDEEFRQAQIRRRAGAPFYRAMEVFPFTIERGWIVVRGCDTKSLSLTDIQAVLASIVDEVNDAVTSLVASPRAATPRDSWRLRITHAVHELAARAGVRRPESAPAAMEQNALPREAPAHASGLAARLAAEYNPRSGSARTAAESVA